VAALIAAPMVAQRHVLVHLAMQHQAEAREMLRSWYEQYEGRLDELAEFDPAYRRWTTGPAAAAAASRPAPEEQVEDQAEELTGRQPAAPTLNPATGHEHGYPCRRTTEAP
jgi:hypothetical protein